MIRLREDLSWEQIVELGLTGRGTPYLTEEEVMELLEHIRGRPLIVQSMEAMLRDCDADIPLTQYSILGLEPESVWGACDDPETLRSLVEKKMISSRSEGPNILFQIWLRDVAG